MLSAAPGLMELVIAQDQLLEPVARFGAAGPPRLPGTRRAARTPDTAIGPAGAAACADDHPARPARPAMGGRPGSWGRVARAEVAPAAAAGAQRFAMDER
jgi:hypothetical protein